MLGGRDRGEQRAEGRPQRAVGNPPVHRKSETQRNAPFKAELVSSADELGKGWGVRSNCSYFFILTKALWLGQSPSPALLTGQA